MYSGFDFFPASLKDFVGSAFGQGLRISENITLENTELGLIPVISSMPLACLDALGIGGSLSFTWLCSLVLVFT